MKATEKLRFKIWFVSRDSVPTDRATCTIVSRLNSFNTKSFPSPSTLDFEVYDLSVSSAIIHLFATKYNLNTFKTFFYMKNLILWLLRKTTTVSYFYHCNFLNWQNLWVVFVSVLTQGIFVYYSHSASRFDLRKRWLNDLFKLERLIRCKSPFVNGVFILDRIVTRYLVYGDNVETK